MSPNKLSIIAVLMGGLALASSLALGFALFAPKAGMRDSAAVEQIVRDYLMNNPEILVEVSNALDVQRAEEEEAARNTALAELGADALVDPNLAYVHGPDGAPVVAEFFDYRCGYCKASLPAVQAAIDADQNVRFAFIDFPILTPDSIVAAKAAVAARRQEGKYLPFHLALMRTQGELPKERILAIAQEAGLDVARLEADMESEEVTQTIEAAHALADRLQINGTPTFIIDGEFVIGEISAEELQQRIEAAQG